MHRFRDTGKRRFRSKITNFSHPVYLTPPLKEFPLEFSAGGGLKPRMMLYRTVKQCDDMSVHLDTIPVLDRETDGRN